MFRIDWPAKNCVGFFVVHRGHGLRWRCCRSNESWLAREVADVDSVAFLLKSLYNISRIWSLFIQNGTTDFPRFNQQEHAGLCKAGPALIGASVVAGYAARSLAASGNAASSQGGPANWQIDQLQEQLIEQWAKAARLWVESSESVLREGFGP